jgi:hypothetical protein
LLLKSYHIVIFFLLIPFTSQGQSTDSLLYKLDSIPVLHKTDSISNKLSALPSAALTKTDSIAQKLTSPLNTVNEKLSSIKRSLQQRLDSLKAKGQPSEGLQHKLDSLESLSQTPQEQYVKLTALEQEWKKKISDKIPGMESISKVGSKAKEAASEVNDVSTKLGVGPLGNDLKPRLNTNLTSDVAMPGLPGNSGLKTELPGVSGAGELGNVNANVPDVGSSLKKDIPGINGKGLNGIVPEEVGDVKNKIGEVTGTLKQAGGVVKEGEEYVKEVKTIQEEGLGRSEKIPELAEKQLLKIDEVAAVQQQQAASVEQMEAYKKALEQYKNEKAIEADLEKRSKELANDVIAKNQGKVDSYMNKISRTKRRFSQVHDVRYLPKRPPNPMKGLSWRERLVPGFAMYTFSTNRLWLQVDPQLYYKLNGNLMLGAGAMYRLSMNPGKITFHDFNSMNGYKIFSQHNVFKGFALRAELQREFWKPWYLQTKDPNHVDRVTVGMIGISKSYNLNKRIRGNAQTLYHYTWGASDPYKPKIVLRIGFDFSLKKKEVQPWKKKLKELKKAK